MEPVTYRVELAALEQGGFLVTVPALPGCVTWGSTFDQAVAMAKEAAELWVEDMVERGQPVPDEPKADCPAVKIGVQVLRPATN